MEPISIILIVAAIIFFGIALYLTTQRHQINHLVDQENIKKEKEKEILEREVQILKNRKKELEQDTQSGYESYCDILELTYLAKENEFDSKVRALQIQYEKYNEQLKFKYEKDKTEAFKAFEAYCEVLDQDYCKKEKEYDDDIAKWLLEIQDCKLNLEKIQNTQAAALEAQKREEEMALKADFYSLHLTSIEQDTITLIEAIKPRLPEPRVLSMLIWQTFYQKQMTNLCADVLGTNIVCGIYKITNKKSKLCYIGQAVNIADRWKQHAKCGLGIDTPAQNKLYRAMQTDGLTNFTFELLEACPRNQLNEKEKFYINLYQSYDYGYNSNKGVN